MAKPHKSRAVVRRRLVQVKFSDLELEMVRHRAQVTNLTLSELIRRNAMFRPIPYQLSKIELDTYIELGRIGNNLNQLTKAVNTAIRLGYPPTIEPVYLKKLLELLHHVRREINSPSNDYESEESDDWETD